MPTNISTTLAKQLSDAGPSGTILGQSATDTISLYGATPIAQQTRPALALTTGIAGGGCTFLGGAISYAMAAGVGVNALITDLQDFGFYAAG